MGTGMGTGINWMWLFWVLLIVGVGTLAIVAARALLGGTSRGNGVSAGAPARSPARSVLDERYARGELSTEEYQERLRTLGEPT